MFVTELMSSNDIADLLVEINLLSRKFVQVKHVTHSKDRSFVVCDDGFVIETAVVLDATGHSRRLVQYDKPFNPGYQIAYGIVAEVSLTFSHEAMVCLPYHNNGNYSASKRTRGRTLPVSFRFAIMGLV